MTAKRHDLALVLAGVATLACPGLAGDGRDAALREGVVETLRSMHDGSQAAPAGRRLAELGPDAVPVLFELLELSHGASELEALPWRVTVEQHAALVEALALLEGPAGAWIGARAARTPSRAFVLATLEVLELTGDGADLELSVDLLTRLGGGPAPTKCVRAFERTAAEILQRDPSALRTVRRILRSAPPWITSIVLAALVESGGPAAVELMAALLGEDADLDLGLLSHIAALASRLPSPPERHVQSEVRRFLWNPNDQVVRAAALALAELDDFDSIEDLVELLGHRTPFVRESAHGALQKISGLGFPPEPARWSSWHDAERSWFDEQAPGLMDMLAADDEVAVLEALRSLAQHRFHRHSLARRVETVLARPSGHLRVVACATLAQLGSQASVPALLEALGDRDPAVATAAWKALREITGLSLPLNPASWEEAVSPHRSPSPGAGAEGT